MTRHPLALAALEDRALAGRVASGRRLRRRIEIALEVALFAAIAAELWIGVLRSAALYHPL